METLKMICIECPRGCEMEVATDNGEVKNVSGNFCSKGKTYAINEYTRPLRVVTTTIRLKSGEMLPVKTSKGVLKQDVIAIAAKISGLNTVKPVKLGQVLAENIDGEGTNVISSLTVL